MDGYRKQNVYIVIQVRLFFIDRYWCMFKEKWFYLCSNISILFFVVIYVISINVIIVWNIIFRLQNDARVIVGDDVSIAVFGFVNFVVGLVLCKLLFWFNGFVFLREFEIIIGFQIVYVFLEYMDWNWRMIYYVCNVNKILSD